MKQFMDIFSLPEMTLLSCVNEYFLKNNIDYEPVHLYKDVKVRAWAHHRGLGRANSQLRYDFEHPREVVRQEAWELVMVCVETSWCLPCHLLFRFGAEWD